MEVAIPYDKVYLVVLRELRAFYMENSFHVSYLNQDSVNVGLVARYANAFLRNCFFLRDAVMQEFVLARFDKLCDAVERGDAGTDTRKVVCLLGYILHHFTCMSVDTAQKYGSLAQKSSRICALAKEHAPEAIAENVFSLNDMRSVFPNWYTAQTPVCEYKRNPHMFVKNEDDDHTDGDSDTDDGEDSDTDDGEDSDADDGEDSDADDDGDGEDSDADDDCVILPDELYLVPNGTDCCYW